MRLYGALDRNTGISFGWFGATIYLLVMIAVAVIYVLVMLLIVWPFRAGGWTYHYLRDRKEGRK